MCAFIAAEPLSLDIDGLLQTEIRQPGQNLGRGWITVSGKVLELALVLFDAGADLGPNGCRGHGDCDPLALPNLTADVDPQYRICPPSGAAARIGPPEKPSGEWQLSKMMASSSERPTMRHALSAVILCGVSFEYPAVITRISTARLTA